MQNIYHAIIALAVCLFLGTTLLRVIPNTNIAHQSDTRATSSTDVLVHKPDITKEYGPLTQTYMDTKHGFSLKYPAEFLARETSEWQAIVDNDTKAAVWLGLCPPNCTHLPGSPFSGSEESYTQDHTVTWKNSPDLPLGEGRHIHILSNREFTTVHGTRAIEQFYEVTGFELTTGDSIMVYCGEDTPCETAGPALRYIFFSESKAPYVISVRTLSPHDRHLAIIQAIANSVSY
jgi:hypothetical protein